MPGSKVLARFTSLWRQKGRYSLGRGRERLSLSYCRLPFLVYTHDQRSLAHGSNESERKSQLQAHYTDLIRLRTKR